MSALKVNLELVKKYSVPGPRYTSYPPATHFTEAAPFAQIEAAIRRSNQAAGDLSLYFHLPFCYSLCWYCGCTTVITTNPSASARYLEYLKKEMDLVAPLLNKERRAVQLHFGGGTPTFLPPDDIRRLGGLIRERFPFAPEIEASCEMDPRRMVKDHVAALREVGFNRASLGVQDNNPEVQSATHRLQPMELTSRVVDWLREAGFQSLNIDLIYGLPHQTVESFDRTLDEILTLRPDRFAVFNFAYVPWIKPHQKILKPESLPSPQVKLEILKLAIEKLTASGYVYIGMDHFARQGDELAVAQQQKTLQRNFQGYSTRGGADIYAFGMSSISQAAGVFWQNHKDLNLYYAALDAGRLPWHKGYLPTPDDEVRRETIMRLMCDLGLDYAAMSAKLGVDFRAYFARELESLGDLEADGLLQRQAGGLVVTELGHLLVRNIAMRFDAYLESEKERRYSKTI